MLDGNQRGFSNIVFWDCQSTGGLQLKPTMESCRMWVRFPPVPINATLAQLGRARNL